MSEGDETVGFVGVNNSNTNASANVHGNTVNGRSNTFGSNAGMANQKNSSRYAAVKYLEDAPVSAPAAASAAGPAPASVAQQ